MTTPRQRFLDYVRGEPGAHPVVSPFLPKPELIAASLTLLGLPDSGDWVDNEIRLGQALDYEPMFMTDCHGLIFPWHEDLSLSTNDQIVEVLDMPQDRWMRSVSRQLGLFGDPEGFPVKREPDHERLAAVCADVHRQEPAIRRYFREWRERVGEGGVIVIGHPHVTWLAYQISPANLILHAVDYPETFQRSMEAIYQASLVVFGIAMDEGIDFMSESSYGLEMISPRQFATQDLPYTRRLSDWVHARDGLFWYHNCGQTRPLILDGSFDRLGCDVIETVAPPPEGDNDLHESRRALAGRVCSKGNLSLGLLRNGTVDEVEAATREMVRAVRGYRHIHSTADSVYAETPAENYVAFLRTARREARRG